MKTNQEKQELRELSIEQLNEKAEEYRRELFRLKLTAATGHVKDTSEFNRLKKNLARALTFLTQKKSDAQRGN